MGDGEGEGEGEGEGDADGEGSGEWLGDEDVLVVAENDAAGALFEPDAIGIG